MSEMDIEARVPRIRYRHVRGITTGMDVSWDFTVRGNAVDVTITH